MVGEFVYHCHIVGHEDAGMMANIEVLPKKTLAQDLWDRVTQMAGIELPSLLPAVTAGEGDQALLAELDANICRSRALAEAADQ